MDFSRTRVGGAAIVVAVLLAAAGRALGQGAVDPQEAEIRSLIDRYFRTWSAQDMERYGQCFMPQAVVQMLDSRGGLVSQSLAPFLRSQAAAHAKSKQPMVETPEKVDVRMEGRLARAVVSWKLVDGDRVEHGYDHFTLASHDGRWRIVNLVFYATEDAKRTSEP